MFCVELFTTRVNKDVTIDKIILRLKEVSKKTTGRLFGFWSVN